MTSGWQRLFVRGVVDDGSTFGVDVPHNTATTITVPQSGSVLIDVPVTYNSGVRVRLAELTPAFSASLSAARTIDQCQTVPEIRVAGVVSVDPGAFNVLQFALFPNVTARVSPGRYFFDVWLTSGTQRWQVVRISALVILASLNRS